MAEFKIPIEITDETIERIAKAVVAEIRKEQNADLVEIVRCRDCKWQRDCEESVGNEYYCADGERRDHETN